MIRFCVTVALLMAVLLLSGLSTCQRDAPAPAIDPPAAAEVRDLRSQEIAAGLAAAKATAAGDLVEASYQGRLQKEIAALRGQAEQREIVQRGEMLAIRQQEQDMARQQAEAKQLARDRRWSLIGLGGCVALLVALLWLRAPITLALGVPSALGSGLAAVAGLSSVPWLAPVLGYGMACLLLICFAGLAVFVAREWRRHADESQTHGRDEADRRSLARQPRWLRPIVTWMLGLPTAHADEHA